MSVLEIRTKTWSPTLPCKIPDNIVSSEFTSQKVFIPSYEKEKRPCIEQLLTNEYQRIWWQEKKSWDKRYNSKITTKKLLQRMVIRKKPQNVSVDDRPKIVRKLKKRNEEKVLETVEKSKGVQKEEEKVLPREKGKVPIREKGKILSREKGKVPFQSKEKDPSRNKKVPCPEKEVSLQKKVPCPEKILSQKEEKIPSSEKEITKTTEENEELTEESDTEK